MYVALGTCLFALLAAAPGARADDTYDFDLFLGDGRVTPADLPIDLSAVPTAGPIPEPITLALLGAGLIGISILRWLRR